MPLNIHNNYKLDKWIKKFKKKYYMHKKNVYLLYTYNFLKGRTAKSIIRLDLKFFLDFFSLKSTVLIFFLFFFANFYHKLNFASYATFCLPIIFALEYSCTEKCKVGLKILNCQTI